MIKKISSAANIPSQESATTSRAGGMRMDLKRVFGNVHREKFIREVVQAEMVTFLSGHCIFHPDNGDPIEIKGGDVLFFPENSKGTWEIIETVRKAYLVYNINHRNGER